MVLTTEPAFFPTSKFSLCQFSSTPKILRKILIFTLGGTFTYFTDHCLDERRHKSALQNMKLLCFILVQIRMLTFLPLASWGICYLPGALALRHL